MRVYLEAREQVINPEFVRLNVTNKNQTERDSILTALKDYMAGLTCVFTRHDCKHEERKSCEATIV